MIGYVTLGTQDLDGAAAFYDALLGELGATRSLEGENYIAWATASGGPMLSLMLPFDKQPASVGNGTMVALAAKSSAQVDALYRKAMDLGADDEGAPGERGPGFYAAYFRDPDGNKLAIYLTE